MYRDRYGNTLTTSSAAAADRYTEAADAFLAAAPGTVQAFEETVALDPGFALAHTGLARARMAAGDGAGARAAVAEAEALAERLPARESAHVAVMGLLISGRGAEAEALVRAHVAEHPRDVMVAQVCTGIYGLIGLSGRAGREADNLAYIVSLLPHYGEDWWCLTQYAFALCETGQLAAADSVIDRALGMKAGNAHGAHVRAHVDYEAGNTAEGLGFLETWLDGYAHSGVMHGHLSWHVALWALDRGETDRVWRRIDADIAPEVSQAAPLGVLADTASILYRAELAGETVPQARWQAVSAFAQRHFPRPGQHFADLHAAVAHAMAGNTEALRPLLDAPAGPAADLVGPVAQAFAAVAVQDWGAAVRHLTAAMADTARIGGSRAQRDLLELALCGALIRVGRNEEAQRLIALRRAVLTRAQHALPH